MKRRTFLEVSLAGAAGVLTGGLPELLAAASTSASKSGETFLLGGDLLVNRLGFGAMRLTGEGIWGWPPDRENAKKVLRRAVELGVNFIDTADAYGPETNEAPHCRSVVSLSERIRDRDQRWSDPIRPGTMAAG